MGSNIDAHCYNCGYDVNLSIGGGMFNYEEYTSWPVNCFDCHTINSTNIRASPLACGNCGSNNVIEAHEKRLDARDGTHTEVMCWERKLSNGNYKCPKCEQFTLRYGTSYAGRGPSVRWD